MNQGVIEDGPVSGGRDGNEAARLAALASCAVLDTQPDPELDLVVAHAARLARAPIALLSLVDDSRQWFKARVGLEATETPRSVSFCAHAIRQRDAFIVPDARVDPRFCDNPLVLGDPSIVFYAGWPLVTHDGHALGTLCVIDREPRELTEGEQTGLALMARQAVLTLELRRNLAQLDRIERERTVEAELAQLVVHDLKSPLTVIASNVSFVSEHASLQADDQQALEDVLCAAKRMQRMLVDLLDIGRGAGRSGMVARPRTFDLVAVIHALVGTGRRGQDRAQVCVVAPSELVVEADPDLISRVLENLIDNARRYAPDDSTITVVARRGQDGISLSVSDYGPGVPKHERLRVFERYVQLDPDQPRATRGLGLAFCRMAIDAHGGTIEVEDNAPTGARFVIRLPQRRT